MPVNGAAQQVVETTFAGKSVEGPANILTRVIPNRRVARPNVSLENRLRRFATT
jgi:hypothetical protein